MARIDTVHHAIKFPYENEITFLDTALYEGKRFAEMRILDIKHISRKPINNSMFMLPLITLQLQAKLSP